MKKKRNTWLPLLTAHPDCDNSVKQRKAINRESHSHLCFCALINTVQKKTARFFTMANINGDKSCPFSRTSSWYYVFIAFSTHSPPPPPAVNQFCTVTDNAPITSHDLITMGTFPFRHFFIGGLNAPLECEMFTGDVSITPLPCTVNFRLKLRSYRSLFL